MAVRPSVGAKLKLVPGTGTALGEAGGENLSGPPLALLVIVVLIGGYLYYEHRKRVTAGQS